MPKAVGPVSNDASRQIAALAPYSVEVTIQGTTPMLFHRWSVEGVKPLPDRPGGKGVKKWDDVESYVYRNDKGFLCLPGEYLRMSIVMAAKNRQDPRSPRKSAMDLYKACVLSLTELAPVMVGKKPCKEWDYLDQRRVTVMRAGITRVRPAFYAGWEATLVLMVQVPEYIGPSDLHAVLTDAGRLVGVADFRPTYGRFSVVKYEVLT